MSFNTWILLVSGVSLNAAAQLLLKWATSTTGSIDMTWNGLTTAAPHLLSHFGLWAGITCYAISVVVWILVLSRTEVGVAYPLLSIGYIVNAIGATLLFNEPFSASKILGIMIIIVGVFVLTQSRA